MRAPSVQDRRPARVIHLQRRAQAADARSSGAPELEQAVRRVRRGGAGNSIRAGVIEDLDQNRELRGEKWYGTPHKLGVAGQMMRDAHVRQSISAIRDPLAGAHWDFEPASDDPVDQESAAFCRWVFFELNSWDRT